MRKLPFNLLEAPKLTFLSPTFCFPSFTTCFSCLLPAFVGKLRIYKAIIPVPFTLVKFNSFVASCWEVLIVPPFHMPFSALKSLFSEFCELKCVVSSPTIVPQQPKEKGGALAQRNFSFSLGKHSLLVRTQEASARQRVVGIGKNESGNEADRREWCDFLLSGLLSCRYLWRSSGEWRVSLNLLSSSSFTSVYGARRKISSYMEWRFLFFFNVCLGTTSHYVTLASL